MSEIVRRYMSYFLDPCELPEVRSSSGAQEPEITAVEVEQLYRIFTVSLADFLNNTEKFSQAVEKMEQMGFSFTVKGLERISMDEKPFLAIANHPGQPRWTQLRDPEDGKNVLFPALREALFWKAFGGRHRVAMKDVGLSDAVFRMGGLPFVMQKKGNLRVIIDLFRNAQEQNGEIIPVIYPEGGVRQLREYHDGFFYVAQDLGIQRIVVIGIAPLWLGTKNTLEVLKTIDIFGREKEDVRRETLQIFHDFCQRNNVFSFTD